jgi:agmatine/peptidylarginine deiminase
MMASRDRRAVHCPTLILVTVSILGVGCLASPTTPDAGDDSRVRADSAQRMVPPRAEEPWTDRVERIQRAYRANPSDPAFARVRPRALTSSLLSANEASPVEGVLVEWWCDWNAPDVWDAMWMKIIGEAVRQNAHAYVYLVAANGGSAATALAECSELLATTEGIGLDLVHFIQGVPTNAFWIRDFGPLFVRDRDTHALAVRDPKYYSGRPHDDAQPTEFAARIGVPVEPFPLRFEGGNFLPNGGGLCLVGSVATAANPQYSSAEFADLFATELGCEELVVVDSLKDYATGHIDMWLSWATPTTLIVGEYTAEQDGQNRTIIENNLTTHLLGMTDPASGLPIEIVRIPMPSNCPAGFSGTAPNTCEGVPGWNRTWRTYLNVLLVNGSVLLPTYGEHTIHEQAAKTVWEDAGFDVVDVLSDHIIPSAGSVHCITKSIDRVPGDE